MPIFDNITKIAKSVGDSAANVANNVAKKSGELVEISKLTSSISAEEDKITNVFTEIGRIIYDRFEKDERETNDNEVIDLCNNIIIMKDNIAAYKQKISDLKGVKVCSRCNTEIEKYMKYCPECGYKQEMPVQEEEPTKEEIQQANNIKEASEPECQCGCGCNTENNTTE